MAEIATLRKTRVSPQTKVNSDSQTKRIPSESPAGYTAMDSLIAEGGESFLNYINTLGLSDEQNLLVLPAKSHYYYDDSELKSVTTLINVKKLNLIKHLDSFLQNVCLVMSPKTNFIGCFCEKGQQGKSGLVSRMYKGFINILDSRTDNEIDRKNFTRMLESYGFQVIDMTMIDGLTYFRTQSNKAGNN
jgi:hypothetical protein